MAKKKTTKTPKKKTKKLDVEKIIITGVVICLILLISYALVNLDVIMPKDSDEPERTVVASVNGMPLYEADVNKRLTYLRAQLGPAVTREFVLNHSINQMLLLQEAYDQNIEIDEQEVVDGVDR